MMSPPGPAETFQGDGTPQKAEASVDNPDPRTARRSGDPRVMSPTIRRRPAAVAACPWRWRPAPGTQAFGPKTEVWWAGCSWKPIT